MIPKGPPMYDRILLPTDGSDGTETAVEQAIEHAKTYDAELHVLHVVDQSVVDLTATPASGGVTADVLREQFDDEGQTLVETAAAQATQAGVPTTTEVVDYGHPHEKITSYATDHGIDLIVLGTHGRSGIDRHLLGSVAEKVIRTAEVPVLAVQLAE